MIELKPHKTLDVIGLFCPEPIIKSSEAMDELKDGQILEIVADDPGVEQDIPAWCKSNGHKFLKMNQEGDVFRIYVRK